MPTVVVKQPDGQLVEHELASEPGSQLTIGRADGNDLVLTAGGVSRKHARLFVEDGKVRIEDLGSANGTFIDAERVNGTADVPPGSQVAIGDYLITVKADPARARPKPAAAAPAKKAPPGPPTRTLSKMPAQSAPPKLGGPAKRPIVRGAPGEGGAAPGAKLSRAGARVPSRRGPQQPEPSEQPDEPQGPRLRGLSALWLNKVYPLAGTVVVGRVPGSGIQLDDDSVSRRHAELEVDGDRVILRDLGSANGTLLNGDPVQGEVALFAGDVVQFGVIEMQLEIPESLSGPSRRGGRPGASGKPNRTLIIGGAVGAAVVLGLLAFLLVGGKPPPPPEQRGVATSLEPGGQLTELLSQCRSYASADMGSPNWAKAEESCNKALDIDPINAEANELIRKIKFEQANFNYFTRAEKNMLRLHVEDALDDYSKIPRESFYYPKVKPKLSEAIAGVMKATGDDCKRYMREGETASALPRCEKYMTYACQNMKREELVPPPGYSIKVSDGRLRRNEWRPRDPMMRLFLKARLAKDPEAPIWECPRIDVAQGGEKGPDPTVAVKESFAKRYPQEKAFQEALFQYWQGHTPDAMVLLQKVRENLRKAEFHRDADEMLRNIAEANALLKTGEAALGVDDPVKASEPFAEALDLDKKLMGDLYENKPSHLRLQIQKEEAESSYTAGKYWADREDFLKACKTWKMGWGFYHGNVTLGKAILFCSNRAQEAFSAAGDCAGLQKALTLAVDGDGVKEKADERGKQLHCPDLAANTAP